jgi:Xaa-Pro dipeptidase
MLVLQAELPGAKFVDATELLGECRYAKSDEEVAFLEQGTKVAEATLAALVKNARPGVPEREVFGAMLEANMRAGGSYPPMLAWTSGPAGHLYHRIEQPTLHRKVHEGDLLMPELTGRWGGYVAQIDPTIVIGQVPSEYEDAHKLAVESFNRILAAMRPGATPSDMIEAGEVTALGGRLHARVVCHGRGLGDDGPLVVNRVTPELANIALVPGACFAVKPSVVLDDHEEASRFGDSVVVTQTGARRLGTRSQELNRVQ